MASQKPVLHGPDHMPGHPDEIPGLFAGIAVTDGSTTVDPTVNLSFDPDAFDVTDAGAGEADVTLNDYSSYAPVLTADTVDPTLGSGSNVGGRYVVRGKLVHTYGNIIFGSSPALGTGEWIVTLPIAAGMGGTPLGVASLQSGSGPVQLFRFHGFAPDTAHFQLQYSSAYPSGTQTFFGSTSGWSLAAGDILFWNFTYETT